MWEISRDRILTDQFEASTYDVYQTKCRAVKSRIVQTETNRLQESGNSDQLRDQHVGDMGKLASVSSNV